MFESPLTGTEKGSIIQVMTEGFKIGERLLRASQVGVSSNNVTELRDSEIIEEEIENSEASLKPNKR